ncbi:MAG: Cys-Gln thioester bond-forming surface protein [Clostridioides sp.]|nr:Cys-Gln thioester bond-forming surface protein [Clostridioides sp.]
MKEGKFIKRITSLFMSLMMVLTMYSGLFTSTADAADRNIYLNEYPRPLNSEGGDIWSSYYDDWKENLGHSALKFLNGWTANASKSFFIKSYGSSEGRAAYCIEAGVHLNGTTGEQLKPADETYWDKYPDLNDVLTPMQIKSLIGRILVYGYSENNSLAWKPTNEEDMNKLASEMATQILIWETQVGERYPDFSKRTPPTGVNRVLEEIKGNNPIRKQILENYARIEKLVQDHGKIPSYMNYQESKAGTVKFTADPAGGYTCIFEDQNNVTGNFEYSVKYTDTSDVVTIERDGQKIIVHSDSLPKGKITLKAHKDINRRETIMWTDGEVRSGKNGEVQDILTYTDNVVVESVDGYVKLDLDLGGLKIIKTSEDNNVSGIEFTITGPNNYSEIVKTGINGEITVPKIDPGEYIVKEVERDPYMPLNEQKVVVELGKTAEVKFDNVLKKGTLKVKKSSEDGIVDSMEFRLTGTSLSGKKIDMKATTNTDGVAIFENIPITGSNGYLLQEINTPNRYVVPQDQIGVINWDKVTTINVENKLIRGSIKLTKVDSEDHELKLKGAQFHVYKGDEDLGVLVENDGVYTMGDLKPGEYTVIETKAPDKYILDSTQHKVTISTQGQIAIVYNLAQGQLYTNEKARGKITLTKVDKAYPDNKLSGAEFTVTKDGKEIGKLKEEPKGQYEMDNLEMGEYKVKETKAPEGYVLDTKEYTANISKNGEVINIENNANHGFDNEAENGTLRVVKTADDKMVEGILFRLTGVTKTGIKINLTAKTNKNGVAIFEDVPASGTTPYTLEEVDTGSKYVVPQKQDITIEFNKVTNATVNNKIIKGNIRVKKIDSDTNKALTGAEFTVYRVDAENNLDKNQPVRVMTPIPSEPGSYETLDLPYGIYAIRETKAPNGYKGDDTTYYIEINEDGKTYVVTNRTDGGFGNDIQKGRVVVKKSSEDKLIEGIEFSLKGTAVNGTEVNLKAVTDKNGEAVFDNVPISAKDYVLREENAGPQYVIVEAINVKVEADRDTTVKVKNKLKKGELELIKFDKDYPENRLTDATFEVYDSKDQKVGVMTETTDNKGIYFMKNLPIGVYKVKEIVAPVGYELDKNTYTVEIKEDGQKVRVENVVGKGFANQRVKGKIMLTKVDNGCNNTKLSGAEFTVYDKDDKEIGKLKEISTGVYEMSGLSVGEYKVKETKAPEGYVLDEKTYTVYITKDNDVAIVENDSNTHFFKNTKKPDTPNEPCKPNKPNEPGTPANPGTPEQPKEQPKNPSGGSTTTPKTGEDNTMNLVYAVAVLGILGLGVGGFTAFKKKKNDN